MSHAGLDLVNEAKDAGGVIRKDRGRQSIFRVVGDLHRFVKVPDPQHRQNGSKDLLASNSHIRSHVIKDCRLNKEAFVQAVAGGTFAATYQRGAIFAADVDVIEYRFELTFIHTWAHLSLRIVAGPDPH